MPRTAKVGAIYKAQNLKGGPFGLCGTPAGCKNEKKMKGSLWGHEKISPKKFFSMRFLNSVTVPKNVKGGPFAIFDIHCVAKYRNKSRGAFGAIKRVSKNLIVPKKRWGYVGILCVFSRFWTSVLFFLFVLDALLRLELLRFEVAEV